ncbi:MAG TPA: GNAT family N-acetyltransferase [Candidatus Paceibacterota bacterium]|nr:GNAT family N-acetyltransferase [Candidatus Paceibacterota bacterium]
MNKPNAPVGIVRAVPDDVGGIDEVQYQAWLATYPNSEFNITAEDIKARFRERRTPATVAKRRELLSRPPSGETRLVAKDGGKVVGFCTVINNTDKNQLQAFYILPAYQGIGIGTALWQEGRKLLDPHRGIEVWAAVYNTKAIKFYHGLGFEETGERDLDHQLTMKNGSIVPKLQMVRKVQSAS